MWGHRVGVIQPHSRFLKRKVIFYRVLSLGFFFFFYFVLIQGVQSGDFWVPSHGRYPLYILTSAQRIPATRIQGRKSTRQYQGSLGGSLERLLQGADVIWQIS